MLPALLLFVASGASAQETRTLRRPIDEFGRMSVRELIRELDSPNSDNSTTAAMMLGARGELAKEAVPHLARRAADEVLGDYAVAALAKIGRPALDALLKIMTTYMLDPGYLSIGEQGVAAMGRGVVPELLAAIVRAAKTPGPGAEDHRNDLRSVLIRVFGSFGDTALPPLIKGLDHPDPWMRGESAHWIERLGSRGAPATGALKAALAHTPEPHRALIAAALERVHW